MQLYRVLFALVAIVALTAAEDAPDPCLAEDYAEANCACPAHHSCAGDVGVASTCADAAGRRLLLRRWHVLCSGRLQDRRPRVNAAAHHFPWDAPRLGSLTLLPSVMCRFREICKVVGPKVKAKKEL